MSKLFISSLSNFGKLMNVGTRNYSYSSAINRFNNHLMEKECHRSQLKKIGAFDVVSIDEKTNSVKLVKDLGDEKLKIKFSLQNFINSEAFWSKNKSLEKHTDLNSTEVFTSDNQHLDDLVKKINDKTLLVELDKGQDANLVMMCGLSQSKTKFEAYTIDMMSKKLASQASDDRVISDEEFKMLSDIFIEKGLTVNFIDELDYWCKQLEKADIRTNDKLIDIRNFLSSC